MSPAKQLITVGRLRTPRRVLIVLVMRSGIDASRLSPSVLSFMKPETILRGAYSASHRAATSSIPGQPCATISALSSAHIAGVNTVETATSRAPGASMNDCTSAISLLYAASSCVIQYSNGLLLIAAMFHVTSLSTSERGARDIRRLTKPSSAIAASDSTTSRRVRFGGLSRDGSPRKAASSSSGSDGVRNSRSAFMSRARVRMRREEERSVVESAPSGCPPRCATLHTSSHSDRSQLDRAEPQRRGAVNHRALAAMKLLSRRSFGSVAALLPLLAQRPLLALEEPTSAAAPAVDGPPAITKKISLGIAIGTGEPQFLTVGLYGDAAPASTALFANLCTASLPGAPDLTYRNSQATRVERDKLIVLGRLSAGSAQAVSRRLDDTGYIRQELVDKAEQYTNGDSNELRHDRAGLLSLRKGGGSFEFVLSPAANRALDADYIVAGEVLNGLDVVAAMNAVPTKTPNAVLNAPYAAAAKVGGDVRARVETVGKPLLKISVRSCDVL